MAWARVLAEPAPSQHEEIAVFRHSRALRAHLSTFDSKLRNQNRSANDFFACGCSGKYPARPCKRRVLIPDARCASSLATWAADAALNRNASGVETPVDRQVRNAHRPRPPVHAPAHGEQPLDPSKEFPLLPSAAMGNCRLLKLRKAGTKSASHGSARSAIPGPTPGQ